MYINFFFPPRLMRGSEPRGDAGDGEGRRLEEQTFSRSPSELEPGGCMEKIVLFDTSAPFD